MKLKLFLLTVIFLCGTILNSFNQVEGYIKSKARHAQNRALYDADNEVDNQIDKGVDKEFNKLKSKILGEDEAAEKEGEAVEDTNSDAPDNSGDSDSKNKKSSKSSGNDAMSKALMGKMGVNMERPANMKDLYEYTGNILMDLETWDDDGDSQGVVAYTTQYSDKNNGFAMEFQDKEKGNSTMIFDYDNQLMIILGDNGTDKSGFATQLGAYEPATASQANDPQAEGDAVEDYYGSFKKTGKTKTIAGYSCDEYYFEDEEDMISYWMTKELPADLWAKMGTANNFSSVYTGRTNGFVMESDHRSKTSKERSLMIVKEVNPKKPGKISTVGYTVMSMKAPPPAAKASEKESGDKEK